MSKINFKEGVNFNEGVKMENGIDFKRIDTISNKNNPKASLWARSYRFGKSASVKADKAVPYTEYAPKGFNKWTVVAILPEGMGGSSVNAEKPSVYSQKMDVFKAGGYARRCVVRLTFTRAGQIFSNAGRMHKFLDGNNVGNKVYNEGFVRYIARDEATLEKKPMWEGAEKETPLYTYTQDEKKQMIEPESALSFLRDGPIFKIVVSPEDSGVDLSEFCFLLMQKLSKKIGCSLRWCAANHYNTEHPHVHIACSRLTEDGRLLRFAPNYVKFGIKKEAETLLTQLLGPISWEAELERIKQSALSVGYCNIDRKITALARTNPGDPTRIPVHRISNSDARSYLQITKRLQVLNKKGLVKYEKYEKGDITKKESCWIISKDFATRVRKEEFAQELEMDVSDFVLDKGHKGYKCSLIKAKRPNEDASRVLLALIDENGVKHLREEEIDEEVALAETPIGGVFDVRDIKDRLQGIAEEGKNLTYD
jgi:hypothetical protein